MQTADQSERLGSATVRELQAIVDEVSTTSRVVGAQVSVILGDKRADFVCGMANAELETPMTPDTIVQVGSTTKVFNAAIVMMLVDEGKLDLDVPVKSYITDLAISDKEAEVTVNLRQLLSMSSGLDNGPYGDHGGGDDGLARYVASLGDIPQAFAPGEGFGYSNAGACIAGYAAELVAGDGWDTLMRNRIFEPAGLNHAVTLARDFPFHRVAAGHANGDSPKVVRPWYISQAQGPAGSTLAMSAHDLASFGQILLLGGIAENGNRLLSDGAVKRMMTPTTYVPTTQAQKWGLGPHMDYYGDGIRAWRHDGGNRSGYSSLTWFPDRQGVLAITANTPANFAGPIHNHFTKDVFDLVRKEETAPDPPIELSNPGRFVGTYTAGGMRYEVKEDSGQIKIKFTMTPLNRDDPIIDWESVQTPLGNDRFIWKDGAVAFFGDDGEGNAMNLVAPAFPARRID